MGGGGTSTPCILCSYASEHSHCKCDSNTPLIKACDISSTTGGSEDSIHCLKPSEVAHSALETITEMTTRFNSERLDEEDLLQSVILRWKMMKL